MDTSHPNSFTRTGRTWLVLLIAACGWMVTSVWAYRVALAPGIHSPTAQHGAGNDQLVAESTGADDAPGAVEQKPAEAVQNAAEQQEAEKVRLAAEQQAAEAAQKVADQQEAEKVRLAAEQQAAEEAQKIADQQEAEKIRLAAEQQAAEEAQKVAERQAADEARIAAELKKAVDARQAAERQAEDTRLAVENQGIEDLTLTAVATAAQRETPGRPNTGELAQLTQVATTDAGPVSTASSRRARYEKLRAEELGVLGGLSARLRFDNRSEVINRDVQRNLDRIFDPLFLYAEMPVLITVATNEFRLVEDNDKLSIERGRSVATYLTRRGLDQDRFSIEVESGEGLPYGSHRVKVAVEDPNQ